jgi:hypothetical protein
MIQRQSTSLSLRSWKNASFTYFRCGVIWFQSRKLTLCWATGTLWTGLRNVDFSRMMIRNLQERYFCSCSILASKAVGDYPKMTNPKRKKGTLLSRGPKALSLNRTKDRLSLTWRGFSSSSSLSKLRQSNFKCLVPTVSKLVSTCLPQNVLTNFWKSIWIHGFFN